MSSTPAAPPTAPPTVPPATTPLDLNNVQGDILSGLLKKTETAVFFQIDDNVDAFRTQLTHLVPLITTTAQLVKDRKSVSDHKKDCASQGKPVDLLPIVGVQIAFSQTGLNKLNIKDNIGDPVFVNGQFKDAKNLGDQGKDGPAGFDPDWVPAFKNPVHGIIIVAGDSQNTVNKRLSQIEEIFGVGRHNATIHEVLRLVGIVRPGKEKGHEHFGFMDGISDPAIKDFNTTPFPGQETIRQGIVLLGRDGDPVARPTWAVDGSILAFRYLFQLVPEFDDFLAKNPIKLPGLTPKEGSEFLGARLVGRWKSGAPLDLAPLKDDPDLAKDPQRNNNFRYDFPEDLQTQDRCPFAAHVRKTNPRNDLEGPPINASTERFRIVRRGIPFGPEVGPIEGHTHKTLHGRGLLFRCYQSNLANGFQFIQTRWANTTTFPPNKPPPPPGFDPIIGQAADPTSRTMSGSDPKAQGTELSLPVEWVVSKGGEYFFSPSIPALRDTFAFGVHIQA